MHVNVGLFIVVSGLLCWPSASQRFKHGSTEEYWRFKNLEA